MTETETGLGERLSNRFEDFGRLRYRFRQNPMSLVGLGIILGLIFLAILAPWVAPYPNDAAYQGEAAVHFDQRFESPSLSHPFGTDQAGRDIFSRVLFGTRLSLQIGLVVLAVAVSIGVTVGLVGGYVGGAVGMFLMRVTDVFLSVPPLVLALGVSVALEPSLTNSMLAIAAVWWPWYARLDRRTDPV